MKLKEAAALYVAEKRERRRDVAILFWTVS